MSPTTTVETIRPSPVSPVEQGPAKRIWTVEEAWTAQLAPLASQHHMSEYSRLKFGPNGSTMIYYPLSLQAPDHVQELQRRQALFSPEQAWWTVAIVDLEVASAKQGMHNVMLGPCGVACPPSMELQDALSEAIDEPLQQSAPIVTVQPMPVVEARHSQVKTSDTHPINISTLIPPELLSIISSQLTPTQHARTPSSPSSSSEFRSDPLSYEFDKACPTMFELPLQYCLDRMTAPHLSTFGRASSNSPMQPLQPLQHTPPVPISVSPRQNAGPAFALRKPRVELPSRSSVGVGNETPTSPTRPPLLVRTSVTEALLAAMNGGLGDDKDAPTPPPSFAMPLFARSMSSLNISDKLSPPRIPPPAPAPAVDLTNEPENVPSFIHSTLLLGPSLPILSPPLLYQHPTASTSKLPPSRSSTPDTTSSWGNTAPFTLGNMFLSSCPGKKVRLGGPVKGRSTVRRDLASDLRRMKQLGVGCIICCLDDTELEFLGAPWKEYATAAQDIGIDVLRIPIPEGLPPLSPAVLDDHLTRIIRDYTLRGIPVLVHCRGGVGRAGLVACCWTLKLGLCGWIETGPPNGGLIGVRRDTLELVKRVISVLRRRRSVKAVETYEQVKFLVDFVDHLREANGDGEGGGIVGVSE